jgi:ABC-type multidrug transport system fused ATPase/permease subunit
LTLYSLIGGFGRRHWRAYSAAAAMLLAIAVLTVWVPRHVGKMIDGLVAGSLSGAALWQQLGWLIAMGAAIYLLRVGWRLQLFAAAYRLGVELRTSFMRAWQRRDRSSPQAAHWRPDGACHERCRRDRNGGGGILAASTAR